MDAFPENTGSYIKVMICPGKMWVRPHYFQIFNFRPQEPSSYDYRYTLLHRSSHSGLCSHRVIEPWSGLGWKRPSKIIQTNPGTRHIHHKKVLPYVQSKSPFFQFKTIDPCSDTLQALVKSLSPFFLLALFRYWKATISWSLLFSHQNHPSSLRRRCILNPWCISSRYR